MAKYIKIVAVNAALVLGFLILLALGIYGAFYVLLHAAFYIMSHPEQNIWFVAVCVGVLISWGLLWLNEEN